MPGHPGLPVYRGRMKKRIRPRNRPATSVNVTNHTVRGSVFGPLPAQQVTAGRSQGADVAKYRAWERRSLLRGAAVLTGAAAAGPPPRPPPPPPGRHPQQPTEHAGRKRQK
ncbi:twin-arginine translocation signal domain-containing protein [Streptomyces sp. NPDC046853]|uniref:twin-arginine translocation signal domain-containing protein n=1 Tax=Streptomyces sp. NPDC046853 TaxID=3154920 RepID=UPI00340C379E